MSNQPLTKAERQDFEDACRGRCLRVIVGDSQMNLRTFCYENMVTWWDRYSVAPPRATTTRRPTSALREAQAAVIASLRPASHMRVDGTEPTLYSYAPQLALVHPPAVGDKHVVCGSTYHVVAIGEPVHSRDQDWVSFLAAGDFEKNWISLRLARADIDEAG